MQDLGAAISYEVLDPGTPVYSSEDEHIGNVTHVLADSSEDVFDGVVIDEREGPGGHRFVDADQIADIHERGLRLKLDTRSCRELPPPSPNPAVMRDDPADSSSALSNKLRRAWDLVSGKY
ncbi:MAG TPA: PRC-barrel domain-containing protein [Solirubrobacteraceae bacterium]|nr:PRC-barrel domain-containing protein [Solirubrobacteraceae bacterium]